jgi:uncharacterized protein DUF5696
MDRLLTLENDHLAVEFGEDCSGAVVDRHTGVRWQIWPVALQEHDPIDTGVVWVRTGRSFCDYYPGRFRARREGDRFRATLTGLLGREMGQFTFRIELDGPWLVFHVDEIDESLPNLTFPPHIVSESLVLPSGVGRWIREPLRSAQYCTQATSITMRWFGGLQGDTGWIGVFEDGYADSGLYLSQLAATPIWLKSLDKWGPTRSVRYRCTTGGYVGQAKAFRSYAMDHGLFRSLEDKIDEVPTVGNLRGGRIVSVFQGYTAHKENYLDSLRPVPQDMDAKDGKVQVECSHADVLQIMKEARELGMQRGVFNVRGWIRGGYDDSYPDIWPPEPAMGTLDELREIMGVADPCVAVLHDNYQDSYPRTESFPEGVIRNRRGEPMPGGYWHGGQCFIMNPREAIRKVHDNWRHLSSLNPRGAFVDTMACVQFYQDFHPDHRLTRTEDYESKREMMRFYKSKGLLLGSENASDFGMDYIDFLENRHRHIPGESIPLWPLVYHDAAFCARYAQGTGSTEAARELEDVLWGYAVLWPSGTLANWRSRHEAFRESLQVDQWHARIGIDEMIDHRYLTEDDLVERTEFSSGEAVIANFAHEPRSVDGVTVPAEGYVICD